MNVITNGLKCFIESHNDNDSVDSKTFYTVELSARIKIPHSLKYRVKNGLKIWQRHVEILDIGFEEIVNPTLNNVPLEDVPHKIITVKPKKQDNRNKSTVSPNSKSLLSDEIDIYLDIPEVQSDSQDVNTNDNENSSNNTENNLLNSCEFYTQDERVNQVDDNDDDDDDYDDFVSNDDSDDSWSPQNKHRQTKSHPARVATRTQRLSSRIRTKSGINKQSEEEEEEDYEMPCDTKTDQHKKRWKGFSNTLKNSSKMQNSGGQDAELNTKQRRVSKPISIALTTKEELSFHETEEKTSQLKTKDKQKSSKKAKSSTEKVTRRKRRVSDVRVKSVLTCKKCGETFDKIRNYNFHLDTHETDYVKFKVESNKDKNNCSSCPTESVPDIHKMVKSTPEEMKVTSEDLEGVGLHEVEKSSMLPNIHQDTCVTSISENTNQETTVESIVKNVSFIENSLTETMIKVEVSTKDLVHSAVSVDSNEMVTMKQDNSNEDGTCANENMLNEKDVADKSKVQAISNKDFPKSKKNYDLLTCEDCGKSFSSIYTYSNHILTHSAERPYQCNTCDKSYKTKPTLNSHRLLAHSGQIFQCDICSRCFTLKGTLKSHVSTVHNGERNEICHICGKGFTRKEHLRKHISLHSNFKPFQCDACDRHFQTEVLLKTHKKHHLMEAKHICDICGRAFKTPSNLKSHQLSHSGVRNFSCSICNMAFIHKASLKKHLRTHDSNRKVVQCNLCSKIFKHKTNLSRHHITAHSDLKPFQCEFCSKTFKIKSLLDQHTNLHKLEKNYSCKYCDKKFAFNSSLYSHVKLHHKEKLNVSDLETGVKCYLCGNFFESNFALASHVRTHSNNVCI